MSHRTSRRRPAPAVAAVAAALLIPLAAAPLAAIPPSLPYPYLVRAIAPGALDSAGSNLAQLTAFGDKLAFTADDRKTGSQLYVSDGTAAGTIRLTDPGVAGEGVNPTALAVIGNRLYFQSRGGYSGSNNTEPWLTDGTVAGTVRITDLNNNLNVGSLPRDFTPFGDKVLFTAAGASGSKRELYVTDGTAQGTALYADLYPGGSSDPRSFRRFGDRVLFTAYTPAAGRELYSVRPGEQPQLLRDIRTQVTDAGPDAAYTVGGKAYFTAYSEALGNEPYVTDGTPEGTHLLADMIPGTVGSLASGFVKFRDAVLFSANTGQPAPNNRAVYKTSGTPGDVQLFLATFPPGNGGGAYPLGDRFFFSGSASIGNGAGLYVADGDTPANWHRLLELYPSNPYGRMVQWIPLSDRWLLISAQDRQYNSTFGTLEDYGNYELFLTDGADTFRLTEPANRWSMIRSMTLVGSTVYFAGAPPLVGRLSTPTELYALDVSAYVPEPATLAMLACATPLALRRRAR